MGRGSTKFEIEVGIIWNCTTVSYLIQTCLFSLVHIPNTISEAADFKEGGSTVYMGKSVGKYNQNHGMGEYCPTSIRNCYSAE